MTMHAVAHIRLQVFLLGKHAAAVLKADAPKDFLNVLLISGNASNEKSWGEPSTDRTTREVSFFQSNCVRIEFGLNRSDFSFKMCVLLSLMTLDSLS